MKTKIQLAVEEYKEPFPAIVKGFAAMGYSKKMTGEILGYTGAGFHWTLTRWGLHDYFRKRADQRPECRGVGRTGRKKTYTDDELMAAVKKTTSCRKFRAETGISLATITYRIGKWSDAKRVAENYVFE